MSWNKNTLNNSKLDHIKIILDELSIPYKLTTLGKVMGIGLNDDIREDCDYPIRKLEVGNKVVLERMERNTDCDFDDYITSYIFDKEKVPKNWELERTFNNDTGEWEN